MCSEALGLTLPDFLRVFLSMAHPALAYLKDGYDPEAPLSINRLHGEAYIRCPNCPEVKVYLSRLPWQTRCIHCKHSWAAKYAAQYCAEVVSLVNNLVWREHLRFRYIVSKGDVVPTEEEYQPCTPQRPTRDAPQSSGSRPQQGSWPQSGQWHQRGRAETFWAQAPPPLFEAPEDGQLGMKLN